jgi:hypothetical protein
MHESCNVNSDGAMLFLTVCLTGEQRKATKACFG